MNLLDEYDKAVTEHHLAKTRTRPLSHFHNGIAANDIMKSAARLKNLRTQVQQYVPAKIVKSQ